MLTLTAVVWAEHGDAPAKQASAERVAEKRTLSEAVGTLNMTILREGRLRTAFIQ